MATMLDRDDGFIVTFEGHQPTIAELFQLLPFSQNVLCLPPLDFPAPTPRRKQSSSSTEQYPLLDTAVRKYILAVHDAHVSRLQKAKRFLSERRRGSGRIVFLNGGFAAAQLACLEALKQALMWDGDGVDMEENAMREAEWAFEDIIHGGVQQLQLMSEDHPERVGNRVAPERESITDKMQRMMWNQDKQDTSGVEELLTPRPKSPLSSAQSTSWASAAEKIDPMCRPSHFSLATVSTTAPRSPTPEEIEAGIEIGKAIAVHVRNGSNTTNAIVPPRYSPPPSPPIFRSASCRAGGEGRLREKRRSQSIPPYRGKSAREAQTPQISKRKDPSFLQVSTAIPPNEFVLPPPQEPVYSPGSIPTPPSSAKDTPRNSDDHHFSTYPHHSISDQFEHIGARDSVPSTRVPSPTPSSTADISGATILPSPIHLRASFGGSPSSQGRMANEAMEPLFPSADENLLVYVSGGTDKSTKTLLERVLGDIAASFSPRTPGSFQVNLSHMTEEPQRKYLSPLQLCNRFQPHLHVPTSKHESYQSYTSFASTETTRWSLHTVSSVGRHSQTGSHDPLSNIPTIAVNSAKSPIDLQNELRALMRHHFPPSTSGTISSEDEDEEFRWLQEEDEIDRIWCPVLSPGISGSRGEDVSCSGIDVLLAIGSEEASGSTEIDLAVLKGEELRKRLAEHTEKVLGSRKGGAGLQGSRVARISLKYLLSSSLPYVTRQHPEMVNPTSAILKGQFLVPEIERYISLNPEVRVLILEFDFYAGSPAILELRRHLASTTASLDASEPTVDVLKIACIADGSTQISTRPPRKKSTPQTAQLPPSGRIRIRTSYGQTTTSYSLAGWTPTSQSPPVDFLKPLGAKPRSLRRVQSRPWVPKQRLISVADVLLPPLSTTTSSPTFKSAVDSFCSALKFRQRVTGYFNDNEEPAGAASPISDHDVPPSSSPPSSRSKYRSEISTSIGLGTSYYVEEEDVEDDDDEDNENRRAMLRRRATHGSKALRWLGLE